MCKKHYIGHTYLEDVNMRKKIECDVFSSLHGALMPSIADVFDIIM